MTFQGFYKVAIVDKDGKEIWRQPNWEKNLILNQGMDGVSNHYLADLMTHGIAGMGTRTNIIDGGDSVASAINGTVVLSPGMTGLQNFSSSIVNDWTGSLWAGDTIKFADGTLAMATAYRAAAVIPHDTTASIKTNDTIPTQSFVIYKTGATGLHREVKRAGVNIATSSYLDGGCGTIISVPSGSVLHYRTYDFGSESIDRTYTEIGVGWSQTGWSSSSFSRVLLPVPVTALQDQRLRLIYGLLINFSPTGSTYMFNAPISGWPVAPATNTNLTQSIQIFQSPALSTVASSGGTNTNHGSLEPAVAGGNCYIWGSTDSRSLSPFGQYPPVDRGAGVAYRSSTLSTYVTGSNEIFKYTTFSLNELNTSSLASFGFGSQTITFGHDWNPWYEYCSFAMVFEQKQTKLNTQTLTMFFRWAWDRVLQ